MWSHMPSLWPLGASQPKTMASGECILHGASEAGGWPNTGSDSGLAAAGAAIGSVAVGSVALGTGASACCDSAALAPGGDGRRFSGSIFSEGIWGSTGAGLSAGFSGTASWNSVGGGVRTTACASGAGCVAALVETAAALASLGGTR